jgi:PAS domain S-box-containing protein
MATFPVFILDKDAAVGAWILNQLQQVGILAQWVATANDLLTESELRPPVVCLVALRPPVQQALTLITNLTQEPRFARTAFILMGPQQHKHAAFEIGADDYLITPPDVIELRKRVRLYLGRADLQARVVAETSITQEIQQLGGPQPELDPEEAVSLLQHAATLTQERDLFETILQQAGPAMGLVAPDGRLIYANPAWYRLTGCQIGSSVTWPPKADQPEITQQIAIAITRCVPWSGELGRVEKENPPVEVTMSITPARDASGELIGFIVVQSDIGQRRAAEKVKERFLTDAATEMRTPVTNIKMREYLIRQAPPEHHAMHLQALERETERLSHLVESMLELARLDAGLTATHQEWIDVPRLVVEAVTHFGPSATAQGIALVQPTYETLPLVPGDALQLTRALGILIDNALEYTPEGGRVEVRAGHELWTGGEYITIQVQDTGIGMGQDEIPRIFDRFYRTTRARDHSAHGVGLGLTIAQAIINNHDGSITVESDIDRGSIFTLWLPCPVSPT